MAIFRGALAIVACVLFLLTGPTAWSQSDGNWSPLSRTPDLIDLTATPSLLYGLSARGQILTLSINPPGHRWEVIGDAPNMNSIAILGQTLYATSNDRKLWSSGTDVIAWNAIGFTGNSEGLAASGDHIYTFLGNKLWRRPGDLRNVNWKNIGTSPHLDALTGLEDKLFAISNGQLMVRNLVSGLFKWRPIGPGQGLIALAGVGNKLYGITQNKELVVRSIDVSSFDEFVSPQDIPAIGSRPTNDSWQDTQSPAVSSRSSRYSAPSSSVDSPFPTTTRRQVPPPPAPPAYNPPPTRQQRTYTPPPVPVSPPPAPAQQAPAEKPTVTSNASGDLFAFLETTPNVTVHESSTAASIRGDGRPVNLKPKGTASADTQSPLKTDFNKFTGHPNMAQIVALVKGISDRIKAIEKSDPSPQKTLDTWLPYYQEIRDRWYPNSKLAVELAKQTQPNTKEVQEIHRDLVDSMKELREAVEAWVIALQSRNADLFSFGNKKLKQSEFRFLMARNKAEQLAAKL